jgi:hypothetical protein
MLMTKLNHQKSINQIETELLNLIATRNRNWENFSL